MFVFDFENVIVAAELDDVADLSDRQIERDFLQRRGQRLAIDPAPVAAEIARAVFGINLRHPIELGAAGQFAENFLRHRFLRGGVAVIGLARNHDHAQFHLLLGGEFVAMCFL